MFKTTFVSLVLLAMSTASHAADTNNLVNMLQSTSEFYAETAKPRESFSCISAAYKTYAKAAGLQKGIKQSIATSIKLRFNVDPTDAANNIGQYLGTVIGYQLLSRKSDEILTFYKASACAIQKAESLDISNPDLIFITMGAVAGSGRYAEGMNEWLQNNANNGDIDLGSVHKGQKESWTLSQPMVRYVSEMADMSCDITEAQADQIHNDYIVNTFLSQMGDVNFDGIQEKCADMLESTME